MENAVVYARYSSHNQTEQSIEGQLSAAHKYAEAKGYNIIHEYLESDRLSSEIENITRKLKEIDSSMGNLVKSVEEGMPYSLVKARMDELTGEKSMYQKLLEKKTNREEI